MTQPQNHANDPGKMREVMDAINEFLANEAELAKAELKPAAKNAGIGSAMYGGAGAFAFHALWMLIIAAALAFGWMLTVWTTLSPWAGFTFGFLFAALLSLLIAFVCVKLGQSFMKKVKAPEATLAEAKATLNAITASLARIKESSDTTVVIQPDEDAWRRPQSLQEQRDAS